MHQIFLWSTLDISVSLSARRYLDALIKLALGLTLDSAGELSLESKAVTALNCCSQPLVWSASAGLQPHQFP